MQKGPAEAGPFLAEVSSEDGDVRRLEALGALLGVEGHAGTLIERTEAVRVDRGEVREHVGRAVFRSDEAEALVAMMYLLYLGSGASAVAALT